MKNAVFSNVAPCRFLNRYFGGTCHLHLKGGNDLRDRNSVSRLLVTADAFGGDTFFRNVDSNKTHTALHLRRCRSSHSLLIHACCMPSAAHLRSDNCNNYWWRVQIVKQLMQFSHWSLALGLSSLTVEFVCKRTHLIYTIKSVLWCVLQERSRSVMEWRWGNSELNFGELNFIWNYKYLALSIWKCS
jgi:hypothetical protein